MAERERTVGERIVDDFAYGIAHLSLRNKIAHAIDSAIFDARQDEAANVKEQYMAQERFVPAGQKEYTAAGKIEQGDLVMKVPGLDFGKHVRAVYPVQTDEGLRVNPIVHVLKPTAELRWRRMKNVVFGSTLQQRWVTETGHSEWRDVPTVYEE
jgi:hypothetical protein